MKSEQRRQEILQEINTITRMERGKLCAQSRGPPHAPFYKFQCWHKGKNQTRCVPAEEVTAVKEALAGHERFQRLVEEFVELTVAHTRGSEAEERKKTPGDPSRALRGNRSLPNLQQFATAWMLNGAFWCETSVKHKFYNAVNRSNLRIYEKSSARFESLRSLHFVSLIFINCGLRFKLRFEVFF